MRIAVIAPPWTPVPPVLYGGIELVVDRLVTGFQRHGHDVLLYTTGDSTSPVPKAWELSRSEGMRIGNALVELRHALAAYDTIANDELGFDVVHDHTLAGPVISPQYPGLQVVTTIHGELDDDTTPLYRHITERVPLIAISNAQHAPVPDLPVARVIHHGIDATDFPMGDGDGDYFLFLGRMSPDKGAHRAMEAAYKAGVRLILCAKMRDPLEIQYFDEYVRPYLNDRMQYYGEVPHNHKLELLARAKGLLFPIRWNEPFGMVMIEAMACGTPVIAFREGAAPEVVDDGVTGFLVDDTAAMVDAIHRVDTLDRAACRRSVEEYFSTDRMVAEHIELFGELIRKRATAG